MSLPRVGARYSQRRIESRTQVVNLDWIVIIITIINTIVIINTIITINTIVNIRKRA